MKAEDIIKENIKINMDFFKVFAAIVFVLAGGVFGLLLQLLDPPIHYILKVIFINGLFFLIFFIFATVNMYITITKHLNKLKQKEDKNV